MEEVFFISDDGVKHSISNPELIERMQKDDKFKEISEAEFYGIEEDGEKGSTLGDAVNPTDGEK